MSLQNLFRRLPELQDQLQGPSESSSRRCTTNLPKLQDLTSLHCCSAFRILSIHHFLGWKSKLLPHDDNDCFEECTELPKLCDAAFAHVTTYNVTYSGRPWVLPASVENDENVEVVGNVSDVETEPEEDERPQPQQSNRNLLVGMTSMSLDVGLELEVRSTPNLMNGLILTF